MFGSHLTLDLYGCDKETLGNSEKMFQLLSELPAVVHMHKFSEPQVSVIPVQQGSFDKGGITGFVILVESHISIHTFPADGYASLDIFSCKFFKEEKAILYVVEILGAKRYEKNKLERGRTFRKHYPRSVVKAAAVAASERKLLPTPEPPPSPMQQ